MENNALALIEREKKNGNLVFVNPEDIQTQRMYRPQITVIQCGPQDFHERAINGRMMPKSHHVDRIGEAAGVEFIAEQCGTRKEGESVWVGYAQGRRRMPDGTFRTSSKQEYEFDVDTRAEEDFLNDKYNKYTDDIAKRKHVIELKKVARQRASTGARLRVIRELVGIPIAFGREDFQRALVVSRIAVDSDAMLEDPNLRHAAIAMATGSSSDIFGPQPTNRSEPAQLEDTTDTGDIADTVDITGSVEIVDDDIDFGSNDDELSPIDELKRKLEEWLNVSAVQEHTSTKGKSASEAIREIIDDPKATIEEAQKLLDKLDQNFGSGVAS